MKKLFVLFVSGMLSLYASGYIFGQGHNSEMHDSHHDGAGIKNSEMNSDCGSMNMDDNTMSRSGMGMHGNGMMANMRYNMLLHQYLGLTNECVAIKGDMHAMKMSGVKIRADLQQKLSNNNIQLTALFQTGTDNAKLLKLLNDNIAIHAKIMDQYDKTRKDKLVAEHHKSIENKTVSWLNLAKKNPRELQKFIDYVNSSPAMPMKEMHNNHH